MNPPLYRPGTIGVASGRFVDPLHMTPAEVEIEDIACGLGHTCRFGGQSSRFYSVAEHSIHVAALLPPALQLEGLMHDAAEAYLGDVVRPVKYLAAMQPYREAEDRLADVIARRFGLREGALALEVVRADDAMLHCEALQLFPNALVWASKDLAAPVTLACWSPDEARERFLLTFMRLGGAERPSLWVSGGLGL